MTYERSGYAHQLVFCYNSFRPTYDLLSVEYMKASKARRISVVSLFSGCGGMDLGFRGGFSFLGKRYARNRFDVIWANEINADACKTYRRNLGEVLNADINDVMDELPPSADVVVGGFPCQDISINGKMQGLKGKRSSLYRSMVEVVRRVKPKVFVAENVGALLMKRHDAARRKILSDFGSLGYRINCQLYHAEDFGVPQTRERVFIVGTRMDQPEFRPPAAVSHDHPITAKEALSDLEDRPQDVVTSHVWSKAKPSGEQGSRQLRADRPGYTMRAECHGNIQFHYSRPRRISMREAARIQSFPDDFLFPVGIRSTERQIGNAVPPVLAWHVARSVQSLIEA